MLISQLIAMADVQVKRSKAAEVADRIKAGKCLLCDADHDHRGLCSRHYQQFIRRRNDRGTKSARAEFEAAAIKEGMILPVNEITKLKGNDPWATLS